MGKIDFRSADPRLVEMGISLAFILKVVLPDPLEKKMWSILKVWEW
jgi:hypothetical protein